MDNSQIETAVIPVAGVGSRMLPATWSIEKCMLPVYTGGRTRLIIDYMVDECAKAGIKRVIFVTTERGKKQLYDYFGKIDLSLAKRYERLGKGKVVAEEQARRDAYGMTYEYVIQPPDYYGTAIPPLLAKPLLEGEKRFFLMGGDDFVYHEDPNISELTLAIQNWNEAGTEHVILGTPVPRSEAPRFGVFFTDEHSNLKEWIEKPSMDQVPDTPTVNIFISRTGFSDKIWDYLEHEMEMKRETEHYITYPILAAIADGQSFRVHQAQGTYLGGGTAEELMETGRYLSEHPQKQ